MTNAYQFLKKYGVAISLLFGLLMNILMYTVIIGGYPAGNPTEEELFNTSIFDFALFSSYGLCMIAFILMAVMAILQISRDPKGSVRSLIALAAIVILFFICYSMGDATVPQYALKDPSVGEKVMKLVEGSLYMTYLLTFAAILTFVGIAIFGFIRDAKKN